MKFLKHSRKGFTLVKLVVVIAVIAILTGVSVGSYFGVMDSAKKSNALVNQKQVSDALLLYKIKNSVSNDSRSMEDIAIDITTNYLVENECSNTNYVVGTLKSSASTSGKVKKEANQTTVSSEAIIFYVEETSNSYGSYLIYDYSNNGKILYTSSNDIKSTSDFQNNIKSNSEVSNILSSDTVSTISSAESDELFPVTTIDGERVVPYFKLNYNSNIYYLRNGKKLSDIEIAGLVFDDITIDNYSFNRKIFLNYENKKQQIIKDYIFSLNNFEKDTNSNDEDGKYIYKSFEIDVDSSSKTDIDEIIKDSSFVVIDQDQSFNYKNIKLFNNQELLEDYFIQNDKSNYTNPVLSYVFVQNYTFTNDLTIPTNYLLVCDYQFKWEAMINFVVSYKYLNESTDSNDYASCSLNKISSKEFGQSAWLQDSTANYLEDKLGTNTNTITINNGVTLNVEEGAGITVEALIGSPVGGKGFELVQYAKLINNGKINLGNNTIARSLGVIEGNGIINANSGSSIFELFKPLDFQGGTVMMYNFMQCEYLEECTKIPFPFNVYNINNIKCLVNYEYGSTLNFISTITMSFGDNKLALSIVIPFISYGDNSSLITMQEASKITRTTSNDGKFNLTFIKGTFNFDSTSLDFGKGLSVDDTSPILFPLYNMNLVSYEETTLIFGKNDKETSQSFILYPTSTLDLKGETIIYSGASLVDLDQKDYSETKFTAILGVSNNQTDGYIMNFESNPLSLSGFKNMYNSLPDDNWTTTEEITNDDGSITRKEITNYGKNTLNSIYGNINSYFNYLEIVYNINNDSDDRHFNISNLNENSTGSIYSNYYSLNNNSSLEDEDNSLNTLLFLDSNSGSGVSGLIIPLSFKQIY